MISSQEHAEGVRSEDEAAARRRNGDRRVTELMSWALLTTPVTMTVREARALATARGVHHIPVLDGGVMVGIICTCDLRDANDAEQVGPHMHSPVTTINASCSSNEALATMRRHDVGALPVLYHGFLIGIVTAGDLVRAHVLAENERPVCTSCGAHHHVRPNDDGDGSRALCVGCQQKAGR
jgi:acetoin utilization protein AcuB